MLGSYGRKYVLNGSGLLTAGGFKVGGNKGEDGNKSSEEE
jgi:hypothetical protein